MAEKDAPILCVDDNPIDLELFRVAFEELGLNDELAIARDGQEALDFLQSENGANVIPAAILLDIKMPRLNGIEALKVIRANPALRQVPVIMLTSSEMGKDIEACYALGANAYVVKPIDFEVFIKTVASMRRFWKYLNAMPESLMTE